MRELSSRMRDAGWVFHKGDDQNWELVSPRNQRFHWRGEEHWEPSKEAVLACLEAEEAEIRAGTLGPHVGTSRLLKRFDTDTPDPLAAWLSREKRAAGHPVLRVLTAPDPAGDRLLLESGARKVDTLLQPWPAACDSARSFPYHLIACSHVADALPPTDRIRLFRDLRTHLHPEGEIHFSFYEMSALPPEAERETYQDGYRIPKGSYRVFLKPWLPNQACLELEKRMGGYAETTYRPFDEFFCRWRPDA